MLLVGYLSGSNSSGRMRPGEEIEFFPGCTSTERRFIQLGSPLRGTFLPVNEYCRGDFDGQGEMLFYVPVFVQINTGVSGPVHCPTTDEESRIFKLLRLQKLSMGCIFL